MPGSGKLITGLETPEECERLFKRDRNARRAERRQRVDSPPEREAEPIVELIEIVAELRMAVELIAKDMPRVQAILTSLSAKLNRLRYG